MPEIYDFLPVYFGVRDKSRFEVHGYSLCPQDDVSKLLAEASDGWHEEKDDPTPFVKYMLGVVLACYREFESRMELIGGHAKIAETGTGKI